MLGAAAVAMILFSEGALYKPASKLIKIATRLAAGGQFVTYICDAVTADTYEKREKAIEGAVVSNGTLTAEVLAN